MSERREEYLQRIPIEGKFGQGKNGYRLSYIRAKRADTSYAWINSIFLVMNLLILARFFVCFYADVASRIINRVKRATQILLMLIGETCDHCCHKIFYRAKCLALAF